MVKKTLKSNGIFLILPIVRDPSTSEREHVVVCYIETKSHFGEQYFVTFIDDHNRKLWAYVLKTKDQVLSVFKKLHARVERETGRKLKAVRADNGGEYRGQFGEYCRSKGIRLEYIVPKRLLSLP